MRGCIDPEGVGNWKGTEGGSEGTERLGRMDAVPMCLILDRKCD